MSRVLAADNLAPLPVVAMQALELTEQDDTSASDISRVFERAPAK